MAALVLVFEESLYHFPSWLLQFTFLPKRWDFDTTVLKSALKKKTQPVLDQDMCFFGERGAWPLPLLLPQSEGDSVWLGDTLASSGPPGTPSPAVVPPPPTCMPQMRMPRWAEVLCAHFRMWRAFFSSEASSPCCRVPIFRSKMQGCLYCDTTFSSNRNPGREALRKASWDTKAMSPQEVVRGL